MITPLDYGFLGVCSFRLKKGAFSKTAFSVFLNFGSVGICESISMCIRFDGCWGPTNSWNSWEVGRRVVEWRDRDGASLRGQCSAVGAVSGAGG